MGENLAGGSRVCPLVTEFRDIADGLASGDFRKAAFNTGLVGLYVVPLGNSS